MRKADQKRILPARPPHAAQDSAIIVSATPWRERPIARRSEAAAPPYAAASPNPGRTDTAH